jgi:hypothetical protein
MYVQLGTTGKYGAWEEGVGMSRRREQKKDWSDRV